MGTRNIYSFLPACLHREGFTFSNWFCFLWTNIFIRHVMNMQPQPQGFLWPLCMDLQSNLMTLECCSCSPRYRPPELLREPERCCIRYGCSSRMCRLVSQSLQTWCCWWPDLLSGIPGEVQVQISASSVEKKSSYQFGLDALLTLVRINFLSALSQRISCLGHHRTARKGLYHCCLVGETNGEHGTYLTR